MKRNFVPTAIAYTHNGEVSSAQMFAAQGAPTRTVVEASADGETWATLADFRFDSATVVGVDNLTSHSRDTRTSMQDGTAAPTLLRVHNEVGSVYRFIRMRSLANAFGEVTDILPTGRIELYGALGRVSKRAHLQRGCRQPT